MVIDSDTLIKNAQTLIKKYPDAKIILKKADGIKNYRQISKDLGIHEKIVSPALSLSKELGFAEKIKPGVYKKITSNMKYISNKKNKSKKDKTIGKLIKKFSNNKKKKQKSDIKVFRFDYESKVEKMAEAYKWLFITENILRDLIRQVIEKGPDWWDKRIPDGIKKEVKKIMDKSRYDDASKKDNLEYTHIGQLKEIIVWKKNWNDFKSFLKNQNKSNFEHELNRLIPQRNAIGHCIPLTGDDYKYAEMRFKAVLKLLKS